MTSSQIETESFIEIDKNFINKKINELFHPFFQNLNKIIRFFLLFNITFLSLAAFELIIFLVFFAFLAKTALFAFGLALMFLTAFSYSILRIYFQTKKTEAINELCQLFLGKCKNLIQFQEDVLEHRFALAGAASNFAASLRGKENICYNLPHYLNFLAPFLQRLSYLCYWHDLQKTKEILLTLSLEEHFKMIENDPTNLEVHASIANTYIMLSNIYREPRHQEGNDDENWSLSKRFSTEMQQKFRQAAERAIEELKILKEYAPNDPWVYSQLAYSYHDLQMPLEEIKQYETLLTLQPDDKDIRFKLGVLYFEQGFNAKGLQIYESLKQTHYKKAESLIKFYGAHNYSL